MNFHPAKKMKFYHEDGLSSTLQSQLFVHLLVLPNCVVLFRCASFVTILRSTADRQATSWSHDHISIHDTLLPLRLDHQRI